MLGWPRFCRSECELGYSVACPDGWSADDRNVCHAGEGYVEVLQVGRMGFLVTTVCVFFDVGVCSKRARFQVKQHNAAMKGSLVR